MNGLAINLKSFSQVVKEFIRALGQKRTYSIHKNWYCLFGILWGIPVPIVTIGIDLYSTHLTLALSNITKIIISHPFHFFFLLHPLLFGIVFGAMGTVRYNKEQKIEELNRIKSNFLSMISHELRTPLTTILGYITHLITEKEDSLTRIQKEHLKICEEEALILDHLIEELLDISKIETGKFKVNLASVDMKEVITKTISSLQLFADNQEVTLENNLPKNLPQVEADKERIIQVVANLIENAIKFNKKGGRVFITALYPSKNNRIIFSVSDTGIGIPEDKLDEIFDTFYQVDSSRERRYRGCGLGLAISKSILKLHHANIWAESKIGIGSKFSFELIAYNNQSKYKA